MIPLSMICFIIPYRRGGEKGTIQNKALFFTPSLVLWPWTGYTGKAMACNRNKSIPVRR